jgi:DNA repair exonuclease SbcCD ATPase subunit
MSQEITSDLNGDRPFEERVFARFDGLEEYLRSLDSRVQVLESSRYDTKPIWERALKEILETRVELKETRDELKGEVKEIRFELKETRDEVKETRVELKDLRYDLNTFKRDVTARLDEIQMVALETRVGLRRAHERIDNLNSKPV